MDITFTLQSITDGSLITGATGITVYISKDGGSFAATTNAAAEVGRGLYKVTLTSTEAEFTTLYYNPVCSGAQNNLWSYDAPVTMPTVPTAQDNAQAVWGAQTKIVTIDSTQAATLATAAAQTSILALLEALYSGLYHWEVTDNTLTIYDSDGLVISAYTLTKDAAGNIIAVTPETGEAEE